MPTDISGQSTGGSGNNEAGGGGTVLSTSDIIALAVGIPCALGAIGGGWKYMKQRRGRPISRRRRCCSAELLMS
jgi:hypothetical protein